MSFPRSDGNLMVIGPGEGEKPDRRQCYGRAARTSLATIGGLMIDRGPAPRSSPRTPRARRDAPSDGSIDLRPAAARTSSSGDMETERIIYAATGGGLKKTLVRSDTDHAFLGIGWRFPIRSRKGAIAASSLEQKIEESVFLILSTGQRDVRCSGLGYGLHDLVLDPDTPGTIAEVSASARTALRCTSRGSTSSRSM